MSSLIDDSRLLRFVTIFVVSNVGIYIGVIISAGGIAPFLLTLGVWVACTFFKFSYIFCNEFLIIVIHLVLSFLSFLLLYIFICTLMSGSFNTYKEHGIFILSQYLCTIDIAGLSLFFFIEGGVDVLYGQPPRPH